jgi:uncharacterized repeat protein (TIGR03833 family)
MSNARRNRIYRRPIKKLAHSLVTHFRELRIYDRARSYERQQPIRYLTRYAVRVVRKEDQRSGALTEGVVRDLLTKSSYHPHGIKVRLESGIVGRVKEILVKGA